MAQSLARVGILSIGDMGVGIAKLLVAKGFSVSTNCAGRRFVQPDPLLPLPPLYEDMDREAEPDNASTAVSRRSTGPRRRR